MAPRDAGESVATLYHIGARDVTGGAGGETGSLGATEPLAAGSEPGGTVGAVATGGAGGLVSGFWPVVSELVLAGLVDKSLAASLGSLSPAY